MRARRWRKGFLIVRLAALAASALALTAGASSQPAVALDGERVLYSFCSTGAELCTDGSGPQSDLIADADGNLYGTTATGGANKYGGSVAPNGAGTVFELVFDAKTKAYTHKVLHNFCRDTDCADGILPVAGLIMDSAGNLYGTTESGGAAANGVSGVVFELVFDAQAKTYTYKAVYAFCPQEGCAAGPQAGLVMDKAGDLYGTTSAGGAHGSGSVFELVFDSTTATYTYKPLYSFCARSGCADGGEPLAGLILDDAGNLYGAASLGGAHSQGAGSPGGVVFEIEANTHAYKRLYSFCAKLGCVDGAGPQAGLIMDKAGDLFGTAADQGANGYGVAFELVFNAQAKTYTYEVLYTFCQQNGCADGAYPWAGLIMDSAGDLYGTTSAYGKDDGGNAFELVFNADTKKYTYDPLYNFCAKTGCADGQFPQAGLMMDSAGNLYGTTKQGGGHMGAAFVLKP